MVSHWCLHGVQVVPRWCLGVSAGSMLIPGVHGVLVVSGWCCVGGVGAVVPVVTKLQARFHFAALKQLLLACLSFSIPQWRAAGF